MKLILWTLAALVAAAAILYLFFPRFLFDQARAAQRRKGGMMQKSVDVGGTSWPYLEGGSPAGEPVVLIHGFGGDKDNWSFYAPFLTGKYRLICPDLPGFGENDRSLDRDHSMAAQATGVRDLLDALGIAKAHIGGNSMGGFIALRFALDFPDRLRSLTLFNNAGVTGTEPSDLETLFTPEDSPLVPRSPADFDRLMKFVVFKPRFIPGQFKKLLLAEITPHRALLDKIFFGLVDEMQNHPLNGELGKVAAPTLIIWGRRDQLINYTCATVQHEGIAGSEVTIFEDVGHVPMIEQPERTAQVQLAFLAKH